MTDTWKSRFGETRTSAPGESRLVGSRLGPWTVTAVVLFLPVLLTAQSVRWRSAESSLAHAVELVFEDCSPEGQPDLPNLPGTSFQFTGRAESMNLIDFQMKRAVTLSYLIRARQSSPLQIPEFTVRTDQGPIRVPAFNVAAPAISIDSVAAARLVPASTSVWAGEVFGLNYEFFASRRNNPQISPAFEWDPSPLIAEEWSKPEVTEGVVGSERRAQVVFRTRAVAKQPNTVKLAAASHLISIQTGTIGFGIISQPRMEQVTVTSDQPVIEIRPLPPAPAGFGGAVGQFQLVSKVVPEFAAVGEPVTWTLELSGTGNWPDVAGLPVRAVSNDFQVVQPRAKRTPAEGKLFEVTLTEDVVLVPTAAGSYPLGPIEFTFFDPRAGKYRTIATPRTTLMINPVGASQFTVAPPAGAVVPPEPPRVSPPPEPTAAAPASSIPRDPLPGETRVLTPFSRRALLGWSVFPFIGLLAWWFGLALRQAGKTDPIRPRRETHARLAATLTRLPAATGEERTALLLAWQRDAAQLWRIGHAAPPSSAFAGALDSFAGSVSGRAGVTPPDPEAWAQLWNDSDRALYGAAGALADDWVPRAEAALAEVRLPEFRPLRLFLPQNLMPFAAAIVLLPAVVAVVFGAAGKLPAAAYRQGEFSAAEKAWREQIAQVPSNWIARHNLSLALAQQDRAGEAAAQAGAAFVQQPGEPALRWHFALTAEKAGFVPEALAPFLKPDAFHAIARLASPAAWQLTLILAAFVGAAALAWLLWVCYGTRRYLHQRLAVILAVLAMILGSTAVASSRRYGVAADARAVVVVRPGLLRSIPTEADTAQKTTSLAAGTMALADRTFLGWTRLVFPNEQTGWVRREELVALWQ